MFDIDFARAKLNVAFGSAVGSGQSDHQLTESSTQAAKELINITGYVWPTVCSRFTAVVGCPESSQ
jgi:hypothetical protein